MDIQGIRDLLKDAALASDPRSGGLLDYRDLQQLLARVAAEASSLLEECDAMGNRLTRKSTPSNACMIEYGPASDQSEPMHQWAHH